MEYLFILFKKICLAPAACILLIALSVSAGPSPALAAEGITFSWSANPAQDEVVGYRLYYGLKSRYSGEHYDYYIDFTSSESCPADAGGYGCKPLAAGAVSCKNLFRETPKCTIHDLPKRLYFAMTAYNAQEESDFTPELQSDQILGEMIINLPQIYKLLLL